MKRFLIGVIGLSLLVGCAQASKIPTNPKIELMYGMSKKEVVSALGRPAVIERYKRRDETIVEYYIYNKYGSYNQSTPICFINNKLMGWGKTYYQDHMSTDWLRLK